MMKRTFDLTCVCCALIVLALPLAIVALILRLTGEGEIFYRQERVGRGGKPFGILKFATMLKNSPQMGGGDITVNNDPRVLPFGRFLRKTKINELPQLFNVLRGDMSLIGYRPLTPRVAAMFPPEYWRSLADIRPGLSGLGSVAFRDEERLLTRTGDRERTYAEVIVPYKAALELWYAEHADFGLDMKLVLLTMLAVLKSETDVHQWFVGLPKPPEALRRLRQG